MTANERETQYRFADLLLDVGQRRLWRGEEPIPLGKLAFAFLRTLVEASPNLVTHQELANRVWGPRRVVTPENLAQHAMLLRRALLDDATRPRYIEALRGEGYRLIPRVLNPTAESASPAVHLENAKPTPTRKSNPEARALYLQARHVAMEVTTDGLERSNALYYQALAIDPNDPAIWVGLSVNYGMQAFHGRPFLEGTLLAKEMAQRALSIAPDYAPALARLGMLAMTYDDDLAAAARYFERALSREPGNLVILERAALLLKALDRLDDAAAAQEYRTQCDPTDALGHWNLSETYLCAGRLDDAIASFRTARRLTPGQGSGASIICFARLLQGDAHAALADIEQHPPPDPFRLQALAMVYHALRRTDASVSALSTLIGTYEQQHSYEIAAVYAFFQDLDRCFAWLDKTVGYGGRSLWDLSTDAMFANVRHDPRWLPFLQSIGKAPEQLAEIEFNVRLPA